MENIWDILIPVFIIGGVLMSAFSESKKKTNQQKPSAPQVPPIIFSFPEADDIEKPPVTPQPEPITEETNPVEKAPKPFLTPVVHKPIKKTSVSSIKKDNAYSMDESDGEATIAMEDMRRAIIAHEILKRKF